MIKHIFCLLLLLTIFMLFLSAQTTDDPDPNTILTCSRQPKPINLTEIHKLIGYPAMAKEMNLEGNIVFRVLVDEDGCYVKHLPAKMGHPILTKEIEKYLPELRFEPAIQNGKPVKFWVNMPFIICFK